MRVARRVRERPERWTSKNDCAMTKQLMTQSGVHSINLKGPWTIVRRPHEDRDETVRASATIPFEWRELFGDAVGTAVFERRFNRPTGLTDGHRMRIVFREAAGLQGVAVNGVPLLLEERADGGQFVDMTGRLQPHNRLTIEVSFDQRLPHARSGISLPVVIEIEEPRHE